MDSVLQRDAFAGCRGYFSRHFSDRWYILATLLKGPGMRVSTRMTLALSAACLVIMGLHGYDQLRNEDRDLHAAVKREMRLLGDAVRVGVEASLRDRQMEDIQGLLDATERIDPTVDIFVFDRDRTLRASSPGSDATTLVPPSLETRSDVLAPGLRFEEEKRPGRVILALPLSDPAGAGGETLGTLVLVRPLTEMHRDLADTRRGIVLSVILLVVVAAALQFALGTIYVTRPLTRMAGAMQQMRTNAWTGRLGYDRRDEVGMLGREFDAMVAALEEAQQRLAREVESRTTLESGLQRVDKLVTVGQISAGLAHEIGSPLQILSGRARALLSRDHSAEETRKHARILAEQTDRITRIVEQLMQFARRRPAHFATASMVEPVQAVLDLLDHAARRRGVKIELACDPDLPRVVADVDQIQQIVLNLAKNALEASAPGGRIRLRLAPCSVSAPAGTRRVPAVRLEVEDDGCGMSEEVLARLFDPFFTTRATEGGTGLGLAVVKSIVTAHGGQVTAASVPGQGSRITVDLPLQGPHALDSVQEASL
jgi:two-component system, NtrC family, sensor histidine kinase HydH